MDCWTRSFKASLNQDPVWGEAREQNPDLQAALEDPEQVAADMEMLREVRAGGRS